MLNRDNIKASKKSHAMPSMKIFPLLIIINEALKSLRLHKCFATRLKHIFCRPNCLPNLPALL